MTFVLLCYRNSTVVNVVSIVLKALLFPLYLNRLNVRFYRGCLCKSTPSFGCAFISFNRASYSIRINSAMFGSAFTSPPSSRVCSSTRVSCEAALPSFCFGTKSILYFAEGPSSFCNSSIGRDSAPSKFSVYSVQGVKGKK